MAVLRNPRTGTRILLRTLHLFGRHPSCQTVLPCPEVSTMHALVRWNSAHWEIMDSSRNGTLVDGQRLPADEWKTLEGARAVSMGECDGAQWLVEDLAPPVDCLFPLEGDGPAVVLAPGGTFLPPGRDPQWMVHRHGGEWTIETPDGASAARDGAKLTLDGREWQFVFCPVLPQTTASTGRPAAHSLVLHFALSQNEEHVTLRVDGDAGPIELGERVHHYLLATLARLRLDGARRGVSAEEQGWVRHEELTHMLGVDAGYVNIQVFRAKQQLAQTLPPDLATTVLVERRRGKLRLGDLAFTLRRGTVLEGGLARAPSGELHPMSM